MTEKTERALVQVFLVSLVAASYGVALLEQVFQGHLAYKQPPPVLAQDYASIHSLPCYPFSSHPMFCWDFDRPTIYSLELEGRREGKWRSVAVERDLAPLWEKGLRESLHSHLRAGGELEEFARNLKAHLPGYNSLRLYVDRWEWKEWLDFRKTDQQSYKGTNFRPYAHDLLVEI